MSASSQLNAAGFIPTVSKGLAERQPQGNEEDILQAMKELYSCRPTENTYDVYSPSAQFHDPIGIAHGIDAVKAQFNGLAKIFSKATIHRMRLLENPSSLSNSTILIDQDVEYHLRESSAPGSDTKTVNSLLTIERDNNGLIAKHTEEWDHQKTSSKEDGGLFATLNEQRKKLTASMVDILVDKEPPKKSEL